MLKLAAISGVVVAKFIWGGGGLKVTIEIIGLKKILKWVSLVRDFNILRGVYIPLIIYWHPCFKVLSVQ